MVSSTLSAGPDRGAPEKRDFLLASEAAEPTQMSEHSLTESVMDAMEEAVAWHTVAIVGNQGSAIGAGIGTGTTVRWRSHALILTAKHVIIGTEDANNLWFFFRPQGPLVRAAQSEIKRKPDIGFSVRQSLEIHHVRHSFEDDLSAIEVSPQLEMTKPIRFFDLEGRRQSEPTDEMLAIGYPSDLKMEVQGGAFAAFMSVEWTEAVVLDEGKTRSLKGYDTERHFAVNYHSADERGPHGFSGAGLWYHAGPTAVWHPNLRLCGIITDYYRSSQLLAALKMGRVFRFLEGEFAT